MVKKKGKKRAFSLHLSQGMLKFLFRLSIIYVLILGVLNVGFLYFRPKIESLLERVLEAENVRIGYVANVPFIFASIDNLNIEVNDDLSIKLQDIYFRYRFTTLFTHKWESFPASFSIGKTSFSAHSTALKAYIKRLQEKYPTQPSGETIYFDPNKMTFNLRMRNTEVTLRAMTGYRVDLTMNDIRSVFKDAALDWKANLNLKILWSELEGITNTNTKEVQSNFSPRVGILDMDSRGEGVIRNLLNPSGHFTIGVNTLNAGGVPMISSQQRSQPVSVDFTLDKGVLSFQNITPNTQAKTDLEGLDLKGDQNGFKLILDKNFEISYADFSEYQALDYAFDPGSYRFFLSVENSPDWKASLRLESKQSAEYGAMIDFNPKGKGVYEIPISVKTHHFGSFQGLLEMNNRQGLLPLPSGYLALDKVRFLLPGLLFSGEAYINTLEGHNILDITAYNVAMNGGRIGNIRAELAIYSGPGLVIRPLAFSNDVDIFMSRVTPEVDVTLVGHNVDGNFLKENTKIGIFGLESSSYKGEITITKKKDSPVIVNGGMIGYLDEEPQIDVQIHTEDAHIFIPKLYFQSQKLLIQGDVNIDSNRTNTSVMVRAKAFRGSDTMPQVPSPEDNLLLSEEGNLFENIIPIDVDILIQKKEVTVNGMIDQQAPFFAKGLDTDVDLDFQFNNYPLKKLLLPGNASGTLSFKFTENGWEHFSVKKGVWDIANRKVHLDFSATGKTNFLFFDSFQFGLDNELLYGLDGGYLDVRDNIGGAVRFREGGSFQFIFGTYTWKTALDLRQYRIDDLFTLPALGFFGNLQDPSTETIYTDLSLNLNGVFSNPNIDGAINLSGDSADRVDKIQKTIKGNKKTEILDNPAFQLSATGFSKKENVFTLNNLRLRHPKYNIDGDVHFVQRENGSFDADVTGALAFLGSAVKTGMSVSIKKDPTTGVMHYKIPNLYVLSRTPISMTGKILQDGKRWMILPDNPTYGLSGFYNSDPDNGEWNLLFQTDALRFTSGGNFSKDIFSAFLNASVMLKNLNLNRPIRKIQGFSELRLMAGGSVQDPTLNGDFILNDFSVSLDSLRTPIELPGRTVINISNNKISIPKDTYIKAGNNNIFNLVGTAQIRDRGIDELDLMLTSFKGENNENAALNWRMNVPFLGINGQTAIEYIRLSGTGDDMLVKSKIQAKNLNFSLSLEDVISGSGTEAPNPFLAFLANMTFDIDFTLGTGARFLHQLFDFRFEPHRRLHLLGSLKDNSLFLNGEIPIQSGTINYLGKDLKIDKGNLSFSGDPGDLFPSVDVNSSTTERSTEGDQVTINVAFGGKLPNIELGSIDSMPPRSREEIYGLLGFGGTPITSSGDQGNVTTSQSVSAVASSVGIAENAFFIAPLTQRLRRSLGFFDTLQIKTDILGNLTRSLAVGNNLTGLSLFSGSEIELGKNMSFINGLQIRYNLRLENPPNLAVENTGSLRQLHKIGILFDYYTPQLWQLSIGGSGRIIVDPQVQGVQGGTTTASTTTVEALVEASLRKTFGIKEDSLRFSEWKARRTNKNYILRDKNISPDITFH